MKRLSIINATLYRLLLSLSSQTTFIALFILLVVSLFLVKLPPPILDFLLVSNLFISLVLLLQGLFIDNPLRLFAFPTILMLTTLFRLGLNISSTKLILLNGFAGDVIPAFGNFVVGGDFVVGAIVFGIIAVVNFVVIAKGSARVAEVAARFVLDALPGRQLAIDAELRSGNITKKEAARLREDLNRESQFFGAMDGAMKWVQGDAIAALVIVFINAVGGVFIGLRTLSFEQAVAKYGVLAIGDGLVSILPALLVSVAAGVIVTHVAGRDKRDSGGEIFRQLFSDPRPLLISAGALLAISLISVVGLIDFPFLPFFIIGILILALLARQPAFQAGAAAGPELDLLPQPGGETSALISLTGGSRSLASLEVVSVLVDPALLELNGIGGLEDGHFNADFYRAAQAVTQKMYLQRGLVLPQFALAAAPGLARGGFRIVLRGRVAKQGSVQPGQSFAGVAPATLQLLGLPAASALPHPVDNRPGVWIEANDRELESLRRLDAEVANIPQYLVAEALAALLEHLDEFFGLNEVKAMLESLREAHPHLLAEVFDAGRLSSPEFTEVLRRLVRERVSIRDLRLILEGVVEFCALHSAPEDRQEWLAELHGFLRLVLQRSIVEDAAGPGGKLRVFVLSQEIEEEFRSATASWDYSRAKLPLDPAIEESLRTQSQLLFGPALQRGALPVVVLCPGDIRPAVHDFFARQLSAGEWMRTIAYQELPGDSSPEAIGVLHFS